MEAMVDVEAVWQGRGGRGEVIQAAQRPHGKVVLATAGEPCARRWPGGAKASAQPRLSGSAV